MIGIDVLFQSWYQQLPSFVSENVKAMKRLTELKDIFVEPILQKLRKSLKEEVTTNDGNLCQSLMRILETIF